MNFAEHIPPPHGGKRLGDGGLPALQAQARRPEFGSYEKGVSFERMAGVALLLGIAPIGKLPGLDSPVLGHGCCVAQAAGGDRPALGVDRVLGQQAALLMGFRCRLEH